MTSHSILSHTAVSSQGKGLLVSVSHGLNRPAALLPRFVRRSPVAIRAYRLLRPIDWAALPERNLSRNYGQPTVPYASFVAAYLVKIDQRLVHMSDLRRFLVAHPALCWLWAFQ